MKKNRISLIRVKIKSQSVTERCKCEKWCVMHTSTWVAANSFGIVSTIGYEIRWNVTERVITTDLQLYLILKTCTNFRTRYRVPLESSVINLFNLHFISNTCSFSLRKSLLKSFPICCISYKKKTKKKDKEI